MKSALGVYRTVVPFVVALPERGAVTDVTVRFSPPSSESFARTSTVTTPSSSTAASSSRAVGASLTGSTVTSTVPEAVPPLPSEMV